jgi:hypothetical protein
MGGFNLPPGVRYLPGESPEEERALMIAEGWRPQCSCGAFLRIEPDYREGFEDAFECNGIPQKHTHVWGEAQQDEGVLAIIGEEFRGQPYDVYVTPCGEESDPEGHAPHREILNAGDILHRMCKRCGKNNTEVDA